MKPPPAEGITSERDFVDFINALNAQWIAASKRLSPRVMTDLYERASRDLADWFESLSLDAPALFPVSWAGDQASAGWFDIGREFTELWHHQQQIRMAVGADVRSNPRYQAAVIDVAVRGLPHAFRDVPAAPGEAVAIDISGPAGGRWTLVRGTERWTLSRGEPSVATARIRLDDDAAWKLLFNALSENDAGQAVRVSLVHVVKDQYEIVCETRVQSLADQLRPHIRAATRRQRRHARHHLRQRRPQRRQHAGGERVDRAIARRQRVPGALQIGDPGS